MRNCPTSAPALFYLEEATKSRSQAPPASPQPHQHLAGPPRTSPVPPHPLPPRKVHGIIFEGAQNSARLLHKSPYYSSSVGRKSEELMHLRRSRCRRLYFWYGPPIAARLPVAGGWGAAAAQARRKSSRGDGGGGSFPFPQPWLRGRMLTCARSPGPYLSGLLERRRKRENFGGVRSGGFRSNPQAV